MGEKSITSAIEFKLAISFLEENKSVKRALGDIDSLEFIEGIKTGSNSSQNSAALYRFSVIGSINSGDVRIWVYNAKNCNRFALKSVIEIKGVEVIRIKEICEKNIKGSVNSIL
jgi:hypothetical protein